MRLDAPTTRFISRIGRSLSGRILRRFRTALFTVISPARLTNPWQGNILKTWTVWVHYREDRFAHTRSLRPQQTIICSLTVKTRDRLHLGLSSGKIGKRTNVRIQELTPIPGIPLRLTCSKAVTTSEQSGNFSATRTSGQRCIVDPLNETRC